MVSASSGLRRQARARWQVGRAHLHTLRRLLAEHEADWLAALAADLGKPAVEAYASELSIVLHEIDFLLRHGRRWLRPRSRGPLGLFGLARATVTREPFGRVLILGPWNYPLLLTLLPLAGALVAGNTCVVKPSEWAPETARLMDRLISTAFAPFSSSVLINPPVRVVTGNTETAAHLLEEPWDFVCFTGSTAVGRTVAQSLAGRMIPAVMELGGKNPTVIDRSGLSERLVRRLVWGKFHNLGQTCIAPDTVWVEAACRDELVAMIDRQLTLFYGQNPAQSPDYGRLGTSRHVERMADLLADLHVRGGKITLGGGLDPASRYLAPTVVVDPPPTCRLMQEEIFGPILPIVSYLSIDEVLAGIAARPDPLAVYCLSHNQALVERLRAAVRTPALVVNQFLHHAASSRLPFGGLGGSGYGRYHGRSSLESFTYSKTHYTQPVGLDLAQQFPPYPAGTLAAFKKIRRLIR